MDKLNQIKVINEENNYDHYLIEIPEEENFWNFCKGVPDCRSQVSFLVPAVSGLAGYNGYNDKTMRNEKVFGFQDKTTYGYGSYYDQNDTEACEYAGVMGRITIKLNDENKILKIIESCD